MPYDYKYTIANLKSRETGLKLQAMARDVYILTKFNNHQYKRNFKDKHGVTIKTGIIKITNWVHQKVRHNGK
jgi:hypothetical protein